MRTPAAWSCQGAQKSLRGRPTTRTAGFGWAIWSDKDDAHGGDSSSTSDCLKRLSADLSAADSIHSRQSRVDLAGLSNLKPIA